MSRILGATMIGLRLVAWANSSEPRGEREDATAFLHEELRISVLSMIHHSADYGATGVVRSDRSEGVPVSLSPSPWSGRPVAGLCLAVDLSATLVILSRGAQVGLKRSFTSRCRGRSQLT